MSPVLSAPKLQPLSKRVAAAAATPRIRQIKVRILIRYWRAKGRFSTLQLIMHPKRRIKPTLLGNRSQALLAKKKKITPACQLFLAFARSISK
jgi:hypothetical protein